jgi:hypothetical protein
MVIKVSKEGVEGGYLLLRTPLQPFSTKGLSIFVFLKKTHNIGLSFNIFYTSFYSSLIYSLRVLSSGGWYYDSRY